MFVLWNSGHITQIEERIALCPGEECDKRGRRMGIATDWCVHQVDTG